jgi:hypothetical protein
MKSLYAEHAERGQALVVLVFAIVGLLVIAGLAIDGGMVFLERRRMQNASDAAALAGTRVLAAAVCSKPGADDAAIAAEVRRYAERNGVVNLDDNVVADYVDADESVLGRVGGGSIPTGAIGVSVTVEISRSTHFVLLIGIDTAGASASALGVTGPPRAVGGGLRPIGLPLDVVQAIEPGEGEDSCITIRFGNCKPGDPGEGPCVVEYLEESSSAHHGLLNLEYAWIRWEDSQAWPRALDHTGNDVHLKEWMANGWDGGMFYADGFWSNGFHSGDYIHAKPGAPPDVIKETPINEPFHVPIFDEFPDCPGEGGEEDIDKPIPPGDTPGEYPDDDAPGGDACAGGQGRRYYHIVGFAGIIVRDEEDVDQGGKSITACLVESIIAQGQPDLSGGVGYGEGHACATHSQVVVLWQ